MAAKRPAFTESFSANLESIESFLGADGASHFARLFDRLVDDIVPQVCRFPLSGRSFSVHPVNGEVPPVKGRSWKLPHYANRGKTSSSGGELASARSCFSTVRTALGKLRITGLLARFDVARSFPQFPRPLLLQPTIWTSERGADLGSGRCQPRPHLPIYRMTLFFSIAPSARCRPKLWRRGYETS